MISDRDLIIGLYEALGRLAKRLTGDSIGIRIVDSETGRRARMKTPSRYSYWISDVEAVSSRVPQPSSDGRRLVAAAPDAAKGLVEETRLHRDQRRRTLPSRQAAQSSTRATLPRKRRK